MQIHTTCVFSSCTTQTMAPGTSANAHTLLGDCAHQASLYPSVLFQMHASSRKQNAEWGSGYIFPWRTAHGSTGLRPAFNSHHCERYCAQQMAALMA